MGTMMKITLIHETSNYEGSGIEGDKIWYKVGWTRARQWEDAMDTFRKRMGSKWWLPSAEDHPDRYLIELSAYGEVKSTLDMTKAIKLRLRQLAEKREKRRQKNEKSN